MTTQNTKPTPGPFETDSAAHLGVTYLQATQPEANGGWVIATFWGPDRDANARLAASAPDLMAALRLVLKNDGYVGATPADKAMMRIASLDACESAIAKAEGKS